MSYKEPTWTPEQLADRVEDLRAIQNVMGKQTFLMCYKRWDEIWETLWCKKAPDPSLALNEGKYVGYDAVKSYVVDYQEALVKKADEVMRAKYPELADKTAEETWGVGSNSVMNNDTCILELADDGQTAKGIWYSKGELTEVTDDGPAAFWYFGRYGVDFVKEDGAWKIWHEQMFTDAITPAGKPFAQSTFPRVSGVEQPPFTVDEVQFLPIAADVQTQAVPAMPEPYDTFANTFSY